MASLGLKKILFFASGLKKMLFLGFQGLKKMLFFVKNNIFFRHEEAMFVKQAKACLAEKKNILF